MIVIMTLQNPFYQLAHSQPCSRCFLCPAPDPLDTPMFTSRYGGQFLAQSNSHLKHQPLSSLKDFSSTTKICSTISRS